MESEIRAYLMIKDGEVINRILWDGDTATWQPPSGVTVIAQDDPAAAAYDAGQDI